MISGVILARNEATNIVACIQSISPHVEEIILIDMESEDDTVSLAQPLVTKVLTHAWVPNFDAARNIAIPVATYDWMWFVDADERIPDIVGRTVRELIERQGHDFEAMVLPFKNYFAGKWMEYCGWWPGYTMPRVLKRGHFQFNEELHSGVDVKGRQIFLPADPNAAVEHFSYKSIEHYIEKFNRYTSCEAENLERKGAQFNWRDGIREMIRDLWWYYEANSGQLDGPHGWVLSWLGGQYRWLSRAKLLDRPVSTNGGTVPRSLDAVVLAMEEDLALCRRERPPLPLGVVWRSPIWDVSGYACESRDAAQALARLDRSVVIEDTRWSQRKCRLSVEKRTLLNALTRSRLPSSRLTITASIPTLAQPDPLAAVNVLRTTFETDRIPGFWLPRLEPFDEIWVWSVANQIAFRRGGVPPEKIRVLPGAVDTKQFRPAGRRLALPDNLIGRFVFLSVFDWHRRKGWDLLLKAYCQEFTDEDKVGLYLKVTLNHIAGMDAARSQANEVLKECGPTLEERGDIVLSDAVMSEGDMAALYRSVDAFVLASRAEGWGRPYLEAMASGLPTIGTVGSGNVDFMDESNSYLVPARPANVSPEATAEIGVFAGHRWHEPDIEALQATMRRVWRSSAERAAVGKRAAAHIRSSFSLKAMSARLAEAINAVEDRFDPPDLPTRCSTAIRVDLEGELFAGHSFSKANESICQWLLRDPDFELGIRRVTQNPTMPPKTSGERLLELLASKGANNSADVVIRHAYPPNWERPSSRFWVHMQPWEFGALPREWVGPLRDSVDEVWAPSEFVRRVILRAGVPGHKINVIPYGIDPAVYNVNVPDLVLPTEKTFRFLFVGGAIERKGIDILLKAYMAEFGPADDVCLVVKDMGTKSFYRNQTYQRAIVEAAENPRNPKILYMDAFLTEGQLASLYAACHCLVAPYRGEGFGLPVLEAMACGLPAIVPMGGPTDDFVTKATGYLLPSRTVECDHPFRFQSIPTELAVDEKDVRSTLRYVYEHRGSARKKGTRASQEVQGRFTWARSIERMKERLRHLVVHGPPMPSRRRSAQRRAIRDGDTPIKRPRISLCMIVRDNAGTIEAALEGVKPWVDEMIVVDTGSIDETPSMCRRLGAKVYHFPWRDDFAAARNESLEKATGEWIFWMDSDDTIDEVNAKQLRELAYRRHPENVFGFVMQVHCPGSAERDDSELTVVDHVKLFRNSPGIRFEGRIHEQILPAIRAAGGEVQWTDLFVVHSGSDLAFDGRRRKLERDFRILQQDLADRPDHPFVLFNLGMTHADAGDHEVASEYLRKSITHSHGGESHLRKAYALLVNSRSKAGHFDQAWQACQEGRRIFPEDKELLFHEGILHHRFGRLVDAENTLLKILNDPERRHFTSIDIGLSGFKARHNLAIIYEDLGDFGRAEAQWRQVVEGIPTYRAGWHGLVNALVRQGRLEDARSECDRLLREDRFARPKHRALGEILLGRIATAAGDLAAARRLFEAACARCPDDLEAWDSLSRFLSEHGTSAEMLAILDESVNANPSSFVIHHYLAATKARLGQDDEAIAGFRTAAALGSTIPATFLLLGEVLDRTNRSEEAGAAWREGLARYPGDRALSAAIHRQGANS